MLDLKRVVNDIDNIIEKLNCRNGDFNYLKEVLILNDKRKSLILEVEEIKAKRNEISKKIGNLKRNKEDTSSLMNEMNGIGDTIKAYDDKMKEIELKIRDILLATPNVPHGTSPIGNDENDNVEIKKIGDIPTFDFAPKAHWDIVTNLDIIDFERATKITGSRFSVYKGAGARLERALAAFMLDLHTIEHGYTEILPPVLVNSKSMIGTGNLPKFAEDLFKVEESDYWLVPTAEVPVTNLHANEILVLEELPIKYTAYSPCFRSEAGSAGRDTRGIIRQHQFSKVEIVKFVTPETSYEEHEKLLTDAEKVLQLLELPYRVINLCTGDIGFSSAKTYDIEVWLPSYGEYKEISSCSNFEDFQARRANIKFKREKGAKSEFVHTLNGSGLAIGRTIAAIIENYQNEDGTVNIPKALQPYMGGLTLIK